MPGTWPSWADETHPTDEPPDDPVFVVHTQDVRGDEPANIPDHARGGIFTFFGGLSAYIFGAVRAGIQAPIRFVLRDQPEQPVPAAQPVEPVQPAEPVQSTQAFNPTNTTTPATTASQATESNDLRIPKRPRVGSFQEQFQQYTPRRPTAYEQPGRSLTNNNRNLAPFARSTSRNIHDVRPPYSRPRGRTSSLSNRNKTVNASTSYRPSDKNRTDPNFNYAGHFSVDAMDISDSEDDDYPGSPMDIDTPEPVVLNRSETNLAWGPITPQPSHPKLGPNEHMRKALNQAEAILNQHPIDSAKVDPRLKLDSATAAARRAVRLFPKDSAVANSHMKPYSKPNTSLDAPFPESSASATSPVVERPHQKATATSGDTSSPQKTEKTRYDNVLEFFPNDVVHSLPGLEEERLPADTRKVEHLKREFMERLRREELESQNAALRQLGVRRPKSPLISELKPEWANRVSNAPMNGSFDPGAVHSDAVELKPRDFAKLVPTTAWLNDDCVHSTLCCLADYVNKRANVKPKADPPKCVAVSSLYWSAFCDDYKKLYPRPFARKWNMKPENFLDLDTVLIPVNSSAHWTLIIIRPSRRTVSYMDSFHRRNPTQLRHAYKWLELFLGDRYVADDWNTQEFGAPRQTNAWDCGMFVITNAMCLALGLSPMCYNEDRMPVQRQRIAAMLLNGGFHGEFDLGHL